MVEFIKKKGHELTKLQGYRDAYLIARVEKETTYELGEWFEKAFLRGYEETWITIIPVGGTEYSREIFNDGIGTFDWWRKQVEKTFNFNEVSGHTYDEAGFLRVDLPKLKKILESKKKPNAQDSEIDDSR